MHIYLTEPPAWRYLTLIRKRCTGRVTLLEDAWCRADHPACLRLLSGGAAGTRLEQVPRCMQASKRTRACQANTSCPNPVRSPGMQ